VTGWVWLGRIFGFVGLFFVLSVVPFQLLALAGFSVSSGLGAQSVLTLLVAAVLTSWVFQVTVSGRPFTSLGLPGGFLAIRQLLAGAGVGVVLIGAVVAVFGAAGWVSWSVEPGAISLMVAALQLTGLLLGAAFVEELLFRGYPFQILEARFGAAVAVLGTSAAFGAMHSWNPNAAPLPLVNITLAGLLLGVAYFRTRSLWFATGVHLGWNLVMALSALSVSGLEFGMRGIEPTLTGPEIWTGGSFGPEGGLLVTVVSLIGLSWIWRWSPKDESLSRQIDPDIEGEPG